MACDGRVRLREYPLGKEVHTFEAEGWVLAFTPDGHYLIASGGATDLLVFDVAPWVQE